MTRDRMGGRRRGTIRYYNIIDCVVDYVLLLYVVGSEKTTLMAHGCIIEKRRLTANYIILLTSGF